MEREGSQVDLFIAVLVRFPQIGTIHYEPETNALRLAFLLKAAHQDFQGFVRRFESHLALFHNLRGEDVAVASLKKGDTGELTVIEVIRDLPSLSLSELNLIVELVSDYYGDAVVREGQQMAEDDELEQNLLIEALLMSSTWRPRERLTGFRENGRVLVFSVPLGVRES
jgi:hypothetical protein